MTLRSTVLGGCGTEYLIAYSFHQKSCVYFKWYEDWLFTFLIGPSTETFSIAAIKSEMALEASKVKIDLASS